MGADNVSMTTMGETLRESQLPTNSTVNAKRHSCDGTRECTEHVHGAGATVTTRVNNDCAVALGWDHGSPRGRETEEDPNNLALHCGEGERDRQGWNTWAIARQVAN